MKHISTKIFLFMIAGQNILYAATPETLAVSPKFTIRSQGTNALRRLVQCADLMCIYDIETINGFVSAMPEYTRSFKNNKIGECLFGPEHCGDCINLKIQGSRVADRNPNALLADYFYLPTDFSSVVTINPHIQNFLVDFFGYLGMDEWVEGMYAWIQFPVTWSKWDLGFCEKVIDKGTLNYLPGYFSPNEINRASLLNSFSEFAAGKTISIKPQDFIPITFEGLRCAKICGTDSVTAVSEVRFALGWNFLLCEDFHLGANLQASAPTGNKVGDNFLFHPQNGNDHHWELGVGIDGHYTFWRDETEESNVSFYLDANITHMFSSEQSRCFDLCGKPLSRYMLAERVDALNRDDGLAEFGTLTNRPTTVFNNAYTPVANITKINVDIDIAVNADIVAMFNYTWCGWSCDLGYNFWGRSCEKIKRNNCCSYFRENTWALKGDSQVFGFSGANADIPHALSATMSTATIYNGNNFGAQGVTPGSQEEQNGIQNPGIDNPFLAGFGIAPQEQLFADRGVGALPINTSIEPVFIKFSDINFAGTQGISHKIFTHIGYTWIEREDCIPFLGFGGEVEFGQNNSDNCNSCASSCEKRVCDSPCDEDLHGDCFRCSLSQWGIWIKAGLQFN
jgi:hypothetical protein